MKWKAYSNLRIKDISWWINIDKSANEIDDKQCIECINFNFEWNKLVTAKWLTQLYTLTWWWIQWLKVIWTDIYHISSWNIYKNWVKINNTWTLPYTWVVNFDVFENYVLFADWTGVNKPYYLLSGTLAEIPQYTSLYNTITGLYAKYVIIYNWRSIWWWQYKSTIVFSKAANATTPALIIDFAAYSAWVQSIWLHWNITWFEVWENWLYAFKDTEIWYSNSEKDTGEVNPSAPTFNFIFNKITSSGNLSQQTIAKVKQEIFYYDNISKSVRRLWYEQNLTTLKDTQVSEEIEEYLDILPSTQSKACLSYKYPNLKLFLRSENSLDNDVTIVYNVESKAWAKENNKVCSIANWGYLWDVYSNIIYKDDNTYSIDNIWKEWLFISKEYDMWDWIDYKRFWEMEIMWKISNDITLYIDVLIDWKLISTNEIIWSDIITSTLWTEVLWIGTSLDNIELNQFRKKIDMFDEWQNIQLQLRSLWTGYVEVSNFNIRYKFINNFYIY